MSTYDSQEPYAQDSFHGPHFREESDIVFHLARFCHDKFGDKWVHLESPMYNMYFDRLDSTKRFIDIDISKPDLFMTKNAQRGILVEVKWIWQGCYEARSTNIRDKLNSIEKDLKKLHHLSKMGCCENVFMCVIDEEPDRTKIEDRISQWEKKYYPVKALVHSYRKPG